MNFIKETQGYDVSLVSRLPANTAFDSLTLGMITNNCIKGLAPLMCSRINSDTILRYQVGTLISIREYFNHTVTKKMLIPVLINICDTLSIVEEYMIDSRRIILDDDQIYVNPGTSEISMICVPLIDYDPVCDEKSFFRDIVIGVQCDPNENCDYFVKIMNFLNRTDYSRSVFCSLLGELSGEIRQLKKTKDPIQSSGSQPTVKERLVPKAVPHSSTLQQKAIQSGLVTAKPVIAATTYPAEIDHESGNPADDAGKEITWLYLMQHYNAENAAKYKAQQAAKKKHPSGESKPISKQQKKKLKTAANVSFAVPGEDPSLMTGSVSSSAFSQDTPSASFAIPGQESPSPIQRPAFAGQNDFAVSMRENRTVDSPVPNTSSPRPFVPDTESNFGETVMIGGGAVGETIAIFGNNESAIKTNPHLIRARNNEKIPINAASFRIGKEPTFADYCISDNPSVSRAHAVIETRGEHYYVKDLGSTNHTFLNGEDIMFNTDRELTHGDTISFGSEDFEFRYF